MKTKETSKFKAGDTIKCIKSFWNPETQTQVEEGYIVRNMTQFGIDCLSHPECWEKVESTRSQALAWWDNLPFNSSNTTISKQHYYDKYFVNGNKFTSAQNYSQLTGREIEEIWRKETNLTTQVVRQAMKDVSHEVRFPKCVRDGLVKPNQKQFKTFDESLFKSYIDKFSKEDLQKASKILNDKILCDIFDVK